NLMAFGKPGPFSLSGSSYTAAVYEHHFILDQKHHAPLSRAEALQHMQKNLDVYEPQAAQAAQQGAQILVFPEYGLNGFNFTRTSISGYLETIPDPEEEHWNPCTDPQRHSNTEVLHTLSCMARRHSLYLVANMGDLQPCPLKSSPSSTCPPDGHWQFNTNVVFRSDGELVARYHKENLYFEQAFDTPPQPEIVTFDTPFAGKFGLLTCFDILFKEPTVSLLEKGVHQLIFPTAWMNKLPLMYSVAVQRSISLGVNVTLLAANIRHNRWKMTGSGIYTPFSATYHHAQKGDPEEGKLLVATVPVLESWTTGEEATETESTPSTDSNPDGSAASPSSDTFSSFMMNDLYTFSILSETEGKLSVCDDDLCCHLQYRKLPQNSSTELYALGAFSGIHKGYKRFACALIRCAGLEEDSCGRPVEEAETKMDFQLEGKFGTKYVYPSVLASHLVLEQPEHLGKTADGRVTMKHSNMSGGLVTACLYGRMYHLDNV
uniref:Biotinidase n=1 Tax=Echeneis naucrates TaxID=173247 RepID=A0A665U5L8_ECHNA